MRVLNWALPVLHEMLQVRECGTESRLHHTFPHLTESLTTHHQLHPQAKNCEPETIDCSNECTFATTHHHNSSSGYPQNTIYHQTSPRHELLIHQDTREVLRRLLPHPCRHRQSLGCKGDRRGAASSQGQRAEVHDAFSWYHSRYVRSHTPLSHFCTRFTTDAITEGSWDEVFKVIGQAHSLVHQTGVVRIQTSMRVGTR